MTTSDNPHPYPMIPVPTAINILLESVSKTLLSHNTTNLLLSSTEEHISVSPSLIGRVVSRDVPTPVPFPPFPASIMDGYAICAKDTTTSTTEYQKKIYIDCHIYAGDNDDDGTTTGDDTRSLETDEPCCAYITTGAVVPERYDTVIPIEDVTVTDDNHIIINKTFSKGQWIRKVGSDIPPSTLLLRKGDIIPDAATIGLLIMMGITTLPILKKLRVGVLSTGSELLLHPSIPTSSGRINDANRPALLSYLSLNPSIEPIDLGIVADEPSILRSTLLSSRSTVDVLITSGGVSMGDKDYLHDIFVKELGAVCRFGRIHMKPGKPTKFFVWDDDLFVLSLPGNPVSALVCANLFLPPLFDLMTRVRVMVMMMERRKEDDDDDDDDVSATMVAETMVHREYTCVYRGRTLTLYKERPEYHRIVFRSPTDVISTGFQRSSAILSVVGAEGLMCLPKGPGVVKDGDEVLVLDIRSGGDGWGNSRRGVMVKESRHMMLVAKNVNQKKTKEIIGVNVLYVNNHHDSSNMNSDDGSRLKDCRENVSSALGKYYDIVSCHSTTPELMISHLIETANNNNNGSSDDAAAAMIRLIVVDDRNLSFPRCVATCDDLRSFVVTTKKGKIADAMALRARRGAAGECSHCALFEVLVGWVADDNLILCVPERGLRGALKSLEKVLGHVVKIGRGVCHRHGRGREHET